MRRQWCKMSGFEFCTEYRSAAYSPMWIHETVKPNQFNHTRCLKRFVRSCVCGYMVVNWFVLSVWGVFIKSDFKYWDTSPIEKGHLQPFCKRYLQVNNKGCNIACRALADILLSDINKRIFKYISYLQSKEQSSLLSHATISDVPHWSSS